MADVPTQRTDPAAGTAKGVASGVAGVEAMATGGWLAGGTIAVEGAWLNPPDRTVAPMTTAITATPDRTPSAGRGRRDEPVARRLAPPRADDSRSIAADVRAHRSRGASG